MSLPHNLLPHRMEVLRIVRLAAHLFDQLFLGGKMLVEGTFADAAPGGNFRYAYGFDALRSHHFHGCGNNPFLFPIPVTHGQPSPPISNLIYP
ncbi:hypothetical protein D3C76_1654520 [compost metagenome]